LQACKVVKAHGAQNIYICATHAVLSKNSYGNLHKCAAEKIILSDTIPIDHKKMLPNMVIVSVASYMADAIRRIHNSESISELFT
jgi:ribose-phosphate pyrophosphokinase